MIAKFKIVAVLEWYQSTLNFDPGTVTRIVGKIVISTRENNVQSSYHYTNIISHGRNLVTYKSKTKILLFLFYVIIYAHVNHCPSFQKNFKFFWKDNQLEYLPSTMKIYIGRYFEKLKFPKSYNEKRFIESILIKQHSPNLNSQIHSKPLEILFNRFNL